MRHIYIAILGSITLATLNGCSGGNGTKSGLTADTVAVADTANPDAVKEKIRTISEAVRDNDARKFASVVNYPLQRPYPLHDVKDANEMQKYYPTMVDEKLRKTVTQADSTDWTDMGWRGHVLGDGQMMVDEDGLYAVNYLSPTEASKRDSLRRAEIASLPQTLRGSWTPVGAFYDEANHKVYRIDVMNDGETYRLAEFPANKRRHKPLRVLTGTKNVEGSAESVSYDFTGGISLIPEDMQTGQPVLQQGDTSTPLQSVYWLDLD